MAVLVEAEEIPQSQKPITPSLKLGKMLDLSDGNLGIINPQYSHSYARNHCMGGSEK